jgi:superfamily II DNA or RNA helicase
MLTTYIQTKGYTYEEYVYNKLKANKDDFDDIWFFKHTPEYIIAKTSLYDSYSIYTQYRNEDIGSDLVAIKDNVVYFIQCKNYDDVISINDLSSFYFLLHEYDLNGLVYYNGKLSSRINDLSRGKVPFINIPFNNQLIDKMLSQQNILKDILPRDYQLEAVEILKNDNRSILSLPCGTGKTYTSYLIAKTKAYSNIVVIAPTRTLTSELLHTMSNYYNEKLNPVLISMDGSRDPEFIKSILSESNIIASTYDSVDILNQIIKDLKNVFIIIDEYHNLSNNNLTNKSDPINQVLESENPILFLSATPLSQTNKYFGQTIYKYSWIKAIENKYICDFKIIIPETKSYVEYFKNMLNDLNYSESDIKLVNKAYFLLRSILYEGSSKCIVYLTSISNAELFANIIMWMQKLLNIKVSTYQIDCLTPKTKRAEYINKFKSDINISLLLNVQILNEGIDIPICDSVFITDPNNNIENLVQRMSRANRICLTKTKCHIYMYCNENKISKVLNYINANTNDEFCDKIYRIRFDNNTKPIETKYNDIICDRKPNINPINDISKKFIDKVNTVYDENGNIWFNGYQTCKILGYTDPPNIIKKLVNKKYIKYLKDIVDNYKIYPNAQPNSIYLEEIGLCTLLIRSKKTNAESFL